MSSSAPFWSTLCDTWLLEVVVGFIVVVGLKVVVVPDVEVDLVLVVGLEVVVGTDVVV